MRSHTLELHKRGKGRTRVAPKENEGSPEKKENSLLNIGRVCGQSKRARGRERERHIASLLQKRHTHTHTYTSTCNDNRGKERGRERVRARKRDSHAARHIVDVCDQVIPQETLPLSLSLRPSLSRSLLLARSHTDSHPPRHITSNRRRACVASSRSTSIAVRSSHANRVARMCVARFLLSQRVLVSSRSFSPHATCK